MELTHKEIMAFYGCAICTAAVRVQEIKQALNLPKSKKRVLAIHVAKYEGLTVSEVREIIKVNENH